MLKQWRCRYSSQIRCKCIDEDESGNLTLYHVRLRSHPCPFYSRRTSGMHTGTSLVATVAPAPELTAPTPAPPEVPASGAEAADEAAAVVVVSLPAATPPPGNAVTSMRFFSGSMYILGRAGTAGYERQQKLSMAIKAAQTTRAVVNNATSRHIPAVKDTGLARTRSSTETIGLGRLLGGATVADGGKVSIFSY